VAETTDGLATVAGAPAIVRLKCYRCDWEWAGADDGRVWGHAVLHITQTCAATPPETWTPMDYVARNAEGLPQIDLRGRPWIRSTRGQPAPPTNGQAT